MKQMASLQDSESVSSPSHTKMSTFFHLSFLKGNLCVMECIEEG